MTTTDEQRTQQGPFAPVSSRADFVKLEEDMLRWWEENRIPDKYLHRNDDAEQNHSFLDGPITANNPMGVHHAWGRTYKDLFLRFRNMRGFRQRFQNGFDGQGLWIEVELEKELGFKSKHDIERYGIDRFVEGCKDRVRHFSDVITEQSKRLGQWMEWHNSYHTMSDENNYTIWHFLKTCHERGWLYEGTDVMPWCPRCGTGLSQHEIVTEGYQEVVHPGLFVKFPLLDRENESLLVWTTTPWTLTSNVVAAVHPEHTYVKVRQGDEVLYLGKALTGVLQGGHEVLEELTGSALVGLRYRGPFDDLPAQAEAKDQHRVIAWDEVGEEEGTGIVHTAPGAGADDFKLGQEHGLPVIAPLDEDGNYVDGFGWLTGRNVSEVNDDIFEDLKQKGIFYKVEDYRHRYPVCWRCSTELVFRLVSEWFIAMDELREPMMEVTRRINWVPSFGLDRELDWLRNMHDWMISKKRYWGLALPIWRCEDPSCGAFDVVGSEHELKDRAIEGWESFEGHSPHRPWIDNVKVACPQCGGHASRIPDVGNPWLDAGIVAFSTLGYRTDPGYWREWYPADWISESFPGQFRNWFYSLIAMSTALEGREPTRAVFSYALMRDENGEEMHKSKGNAIWFEDAAGQMGVDPMRWLYARQSVGANINFGYGPVDDVRRRFIIPLWNVYSFFVTYANLDGWSPDQSLLPSPVAGGPAFATVGASNPSDHVPSPPAGEGQGEGESNLSELDRWLLSETNRLTGRVTEYLDTWRPMEAMHAIESFIDGLSNWYVRRSRRRFWRGEHDADKQAAYSTLYTALTTLARLLAPVTPFLTEAMYRNLVSERVPGAPESVHLADWPTVDESAIDPDLSDSVNLARRLASLGRSARASAGIKVRQPLAELRVDLRDDRERGFLSLIEGQLKEELNVKGVRAVSEDDTLLSYVVKPNLPVLGPKYGSQLPEIRAALGEADAAAVAASVERGEDVELGGFTLAPDDLLVERASLKGYSVAAEAGYAAAVKTELTPELEAEGIARETVHMAQNLRKSAGLEISDRIRLYVDAHERVAEALRAHEDYVKGETLANTLELVAPPQNASTETHKLDGAEVTLGVVKE